MVYANNKVIQIRKRNGKILDFDQSKIALAIFKAMRAVGEPNKEQSDQLAEKVVERLNARFQERSIPAVEEIQDIVEEILIEARLIKVAKAYIIYRDQHAKMRQWERMVNSDDVMEGYLSQLDWRVKENANMDYSLQGLNNHVASIVSANYWLNKIYPPNIAQAHSSGVFHLHDLQTLAPYCCGWDLRDLLLRGFSGVKGKVESKPPRHLVTALSQLFNFFYTLQGEAAGAQAISNFDTYLAPFIRQDNLNYKQVKQNIQLFLFNMNVPTRVGFQTPFTNVTMDLFVPSNLANEPVIIGGEPQKATYGEFQAEMDMLNQAFVEVMTEGDRKGRVLSWPIPTYNVTADWNWNAPIIEKIMDMTAKYGIPYFSNFINSDMKPEDARSMCPLAGEEKVLLLSSRGRVVEYSQIRNIYEGNSRQEDYYIYSAGEFVKGKFRKFNNQKMLQVSLANGHEIKMSSQHLNYVMAGGQEIILKAEALATGMRLPYSLKSYEGSGGHAELGYFVGAFAGDGSFDGDTTVVFSLEGHYKKEVIGKLQNIAQEYFAGHSTIVKDKNTKLVTLKVHSKTAVGLCKDFVEGKERNKHYAARLFVTSLEFRQGVLAGHYATDGGNRNRIYTSSWSMVESLNMLAATLGTTTSLYKDAREGRLGVEPNYAVLVYQLNRKKYGDVWLKKKDKLWVKIKSIKLITNSSAYCFEVANGQPIFTVGTTGILTHNCRLRLDNRELKKRGGSLFGANPLTGSIGVVTINLPRLGYLAKSKAEFFSRLGEIMDLAREALKIKRQVLERLTEGGLYPYSRYYLFSIKERFGQYWKNHFNTIGLNGGNEACRNLLGCTIADPEGHRFAREILDFMRERLKDYQNESNDLFNLEATPAEGTSYRFAKLDKEKYPDIIVANEEAFQNVGAPPYYTNSTHLPVNYTDDIFEALRLQDDLQTRYTGGTVLHGFVGERLPSGDSTKALIKKIAENFQLPYFTITPTFSVCPIHGYLEGEHEYCPLCDEEMGYVDNLVLEKAESAKM